MYAGKLWLAKLIHTEDSTNCNFKKRHSIRNNILIMPQNIPLCGMNSATISADKDSHVLKSTEFFLPYSKVHLNEL